MKAIKWLLISLLAVVIALLVAAYVTIANYPLEDVRALIEDQVEEATGRKLVIAGDVSLDLSLTPSVVLEDVRLADASWAGKEPMARVRRLELEVALLSLLSNELAFERVALVGPELNLRQEASGRANWDLGSGGRADTLPSFKAIEVTGGRIVLRLANEKPREIGLERLEAGSAGLDDPLSGTASGRFDGEAFDLAFGLGSIRQMLVRDEIPLSVQGSVGEAQVSLDGEAAEGRLRMTASFSDKSLELLSHLLQRDLPAVGPVGARLAVNRQGPVTDVSELDVSLGPSTISGALKVTERSGRPLVEGHLRAGRLDLGALLVGPWAPETEPKPAHKLLIPDMALPLDLLSAADADLALAVDTLVLPGGQTITQLEGKAGLAERRLRFRPLAFAYGGGRFSGTLEIDAAQRPAKTSLDMNVAGLAYGPLFGLPLTGGLDASATLTGEGEDLRGLVGSMTGRSRAVSSDTVVDSGLLAIVGADLLRIFQPLFGGAERLPLACAVSDLTWAGGVGSSEATALAAESFVTTVSGDVDLLKERLNLYVDTSGRGVGLPALVVPFRVTGAIRDPQVLPDPAGTAVGAAKVAGMVMLPPLLAVDLLSIELNKLGDPKKACLKAVSTIEAGGGTEAFVARWASKSGDAAKALLEGAAGAVGGVGRGLEKAGETVGDTVGEGVDDAARGLKSLFGN